MDRINTAAGKTVFGTEKGESRSVVPEQTVLRSDPQQASAVLHHCTDGEIRESLFLSVDFESVVLSAE
jgi:hypothetical protein